MFELKQYFQFQLIKLNENLFLEPCLNKINNLRIQEKKY